MALPKLSISRYLPAEAEASGRTRPIDIFGTDFEVPTGFAPQWAGNFEPVLAILKKVFGDQLADLVDMDTANVSDLVKAGAAGNLKVGDLMDAALDPVNWQTVKVCLVGGVVQETGLELAGLLPDIFGAEAVPVLLGFKLSVQEWMALARVLGEAWGVGLGELLPSPSSSTAGGTTSKATSRPTTTSTPAKRSGNPARKAASAPAG